MKDQACMEAHHQEAAEQYRQLFEDAPTPYHELNVQGVIQRVNKAECKMLEYAPEEMLGRHICDFVAPQDAEKCRNAFLFKITGKKKPSAPFIRAYRTKNNREIFVEIYDQLMRDREGKIIGMRSALIDVTERVEEEAAFRSDQRWLDRVFYALEEPVLVLDRLGRVTFANPGAEKLLGWTAKELAGIPFIEKFPAHFTPDSQHPPYSLHEALHRSWQGVATFLTAREEKQEAVVSTSPLFTAKEESIGLVMVWKPRFGAVSHGSQGE